MGIASLILGVISIIFSFIPFIRYLAFIPAIVGLILGIDELFSKRKKKKKSDPIVGIVFSGISLIVVTFHLIILLFFGMISGSQIFQEVINEMTDYYEPQYRYNERYNYNYNDYEEFNSIDYNEFI